MAKYLRILFITILLSVCVISVPAHAEGTTQIVESQSSSDSILLYVSGLNSSISNAEYQIKTEKCDVRIEGIADNIYTIILWDNSLSVMGKSGSNSDKEVRYLLRSIVSNGVDGEQFAIFALSQSPTLLVDFTPDKDSLCRVIDNTAIENKDAYVVENLYDIVKEVNDSKSEDFYRIIVISDGVDSSSLGATKDELDKILEVHNYPVYTIGASKKNEKEGENFKSMHSLARATGAQYFTYNGDPSQITNVLYEDTYVMKFRCEVPEELRDGSRVNTKLTVDGREFEAEVQMPWADGEIIADEVIEETPVEIEETEEEEPKEEKEKKPLRTPSLSDEEESDSIIDKLIDTFSLTGIIIIIAILVVFISIIIIVILISNSKKRKTLQNDENRIKMYDKLDMELENGWKNRAGETTEMYGQHSGESTMMLFDTPSELSNSNRMVILSNMDYPGISYQAPLTGVITIGREKYNTITIENDRSVSKTHCEIFEMNGEIYIKDSGSSNGTYLGPKDLNPRLTGPERLMNNVTVSIGQYLYSVTIC